MLGKTLTLTVFEVDPASIRFEDVETGAFDRVPSPSRVARKTVVAGWCHPANPLLPPSPDACKQGSWWWLGLRVDTWAAPAGRMRHELDLRKRDWLQETGRERVPKTVVNEMKEQLFVELARPSTKLHTVALNLLSGRLLLDSASSAAQAAFDRAWSKSWPALLPERRTSEHFGSSRFLLWLWWRLEERERDLNVAGQVWDLWVDEQIEFEGGGTSSRVKGGSAGTHRPSFASLTAGLLPSRIRLGFSAQGCDQSVMLCRPPEEIRSLRFSSSCEGLEDQMDRVEAALEVLDELDRRYIALVSDEDSQASVERAIEEWKSEWNRTLAPTKEVSNDAAPAA